MEQFKGMNQDERILDVLSDYHEAKGIGYTPSKQEVLCSHEINIQFMARGCVIRVGCKVIPFSSTEEAIQELKKYFDNPYETQKQWRNQLI